MWIGFFSITVHNLHGVIRSHIFCKFNNAFAFLQGFLRLSSQAFNPIVEISRLLKSISIKTWNRCMENWSFICISSIYSASIIFNLCKQIRKTHPGDKTVATEKSKTCRHGQIQTERIKVLCKGLPKTSEEAGCGSKDYFKGFLPQQYLLDL